jgi:hypothetical protein
MCGSLSQIINKTDMKISEQRNLHSVGVATFFFFQTRHKREHRVSRVVQVKK